MRIFSALAAFAVFAALVPAAPAAAKTRITWPAGSTVQAGESVAVVVRSSRTVRVALLRLSSAGRPFQTGAAQRLRTGRFVATVPPATTELRYLLAVDDRGRRRSRTITALAPTPPPMPPPPPCAESGSKVETAIDRRAAARGETVTMTIRNAGATCLTYGAAFHFERWTGAGWERAGDPMRAWPAWAAGLDPGQTYTLAAEVWRELEPGRHRLVKEFDAPEGTVVAAEEIEITG